jgi:hypothetical protein
MWNLTIQNDHDFYIHIATTAILVHNCDELPGVGDFPTKVVNTNMAHAAAQAVERAGFSNPASARIALQELGQSIESSGFPEGTIPDTNPNSVLVPFAENNYAVYRIMNNGNAVLRTVLNMR